MTNTPSMAEMAEINLSIVREKIAAGQSHATNKLTYTAKIWTLGKEPTSQAASSISRCEKCNRKTWFTVQVLDRRAYWCGCGNH